MAAYLTDQGSYVAVGGAYLDDSNGLDCCCGGCWFECLSCFCEAEATVYLACNIGVPPGSNVFLWQGVCYSIGPIVASLPPGAVVADVPLVFHDDCSACCAPVFCCTTAQCALCPATVTVSIQGLTSSNDSQDCQNVMCGGIVFQMALDAGCLWRIVPNTDPVIDFNCYPDSFFACTEAACQILVGPNAFINCLNEGQDQHYYRMSVSGSLPAPTSPVFPVPNCSASVCETYCGLNFTVAAESARFGNEAPCPCPGDIGLSVVSWGGLIAPPSVTVS